MASTKTPAHSPAVLIVIVNYRTADLTIRCLQSLAPEVSQLPGVRVAVVDNDSQDGSAEKIGDAIASSHWQSWASLIPADRNGGYAYGNNVAIRPSLQAPSPPAYYWLLNSDAEARPGALKALVDFLEQHPEVGIAGSRIEDPDGTPWRYAFRFPSIWSELDRGLRLGIVSQLLSRWVVAQKMTDEAQPIDWLPGASMIIRRQVFEAVGLMDEGYFLYYEETDFCLQAKQAGWACWYVPQSRVMHISGQSTGVTAKEGPPQRLPQYVFDSRRHYFVKNHGRGYAVLADLAWLGGHLIWQARRLIQRKPSVDPPYLFRDFLQHSTILRLNG